MSTPGEGQREARIIEGWVDAEWEHDWDRTGMVALWDDPEIGGPHRCTLIIHNAGASVTEPAEEK